MRTSRKDRRSERIPATHRLLLTILTPSGAELLKEIVTAVDVSQHGARIRGRRTLQSNWKGSLVQLKSGRQVPCRVVWQAKLSPAGEFMESGLEILEDYDFWERNFSNPDAEPEPDTVVIENSNPDAEPDPATVVIENSMLSPEELLKELRKSSAFQTEEGGNLLEAVWCGLVEQLEERNIFTRTELVASIRRISQQAR